MPGGRYRVLLVVAAAVAALTVLHWYPGSAGHRDTVANADTAPASADVTALLNQVQVVDHIDPAPGYQRSCKKDQGCVFGPAWQDPTAHSGCDVRNRLLAASLQNVAFKPNTHDCKVVAGQLNPDPYSGNVIDLHQVAADHIYPLRDAWDASASGWTLQRRQVFANDMSELIAVSSTQNSSKGDKTLASWLPPKNKCAYVARYLAVAVKYQLPITVKDRDAAVTACGGV